MPRKQVVFTLPLVRDTGHLESILAVLTVRGAISRNQAHVIRLAAARAVPCAFELHQRTPKGTTYVRAGADQFSVNVRAKLKRETP
jgi:hypothetical protein